MIIIIYIRCQQCMAYRPNPAYGTTVELHRALPVPMPRLWLSSKELHGAEELEVVLCLWRLSLPPSLRLWCSWSGVVPGPGWGVECPRQEAGSMEATLDHQPQCTSLPGRSCTHPTARGQRCSDAWAQLPTRKLLYCSFLYFPHLPPAPTIKPNSNTATLWLRDTVSSQPKNVGLGKAGSLLQLLPFPPTPSLFQTETWKMLSAPIYTSSHSKQAKRRLPR